MYVYIYSICYMNLKHNFIQYNKKINLLLEISKLKK